MPKQRAAKQPPTPIDTSPPINPSLNPIRPRSANKVRQSLDDEGNQERIIAGAPTEAMKPGSPPGLIVSTPRQLTIEDFELVHLLGQGGVGNVWYAKKKDTQQEFAGKIEQASSSAHWHI